MALGRKRLILDFYYARGALLCRQAALSASISTNGLHTAIFEEEGGRWGLLTEGQIIMARERGGGNACWHLASKSRAYPSCS